MENIDALIAAWNDLTGQQLNARAFERVVYDFLAMGFTVDDLRCVIRFKQHRNRDYRSGVGFRMNAFKIMGDTELFAADLAEARAVGRNRVKLDARDVVLSEWRRTLTTTRTAAGAVHVSEALRKLKESL